MCPYCHSEKTEEIIQPSFIFFINMAKFKCLDCGKEF